MILVSPCNSMLQVTYTSGHIMLNVYKYIKNREVDQVFFFFIQ